MKPMMYLWCTTFKNQLKMSLRKPSNLIATIFFAGYFFMMLWSFTISVGTFKLGTMDIAPVLGFFVVLYSPLNLATYAKRKGIAFKKSDVNLLFTAPLSPKFIMLSAKLRTVWADILMSVFVSCVAILGFHISFWKVLVYFFFTTVIKQILETSLVLILYTNETLTEKQRNLISVIIYIILGIFVLSVGACILKNDFQVLSARKIMENSFFQMVPLIGWNVAFVFLLFSEVTVINIIGSVLYLATAVALFIVARKMKCQGEYFEDAMKFADDYEEALRKSKKGEMAVIGKKTKYKQKSIEYKGTGAKAIFYRQLLEYKKNRWFIFGFSSVLYLVFGVALGITGKIIPDFIEVQELRYLIIPGIMAYIGTMISTKKTKWTSELEHPLTFLIPDGAMKKMWYATLAEHIKAFVDGMLITIPAAIGMGLEFDAVILTILCSVFLNAGNIYTELLIRFISGKNVVGVLYNLIKLVFEVILIGVGVIGGFIGWILGGFTRMNIVLVGVNIALFVVAFIMALFSSFLFERMDSAD